MEQQQRMIEVIKPEAIMTIKINRDFYTRLVVILNTIMDGKSMEELNDAAKQIDSKVVNDVWIYNYETMLYLLKACEDYCKANNLTEMRSFDDLKQEAEKMQQAQKESLEQKPDPQ